MKRTFFLLILACVVHVATAQTLDSLVSHAMRFAQRQLRQTVAELGDSVRIPRSTLADGSWRTSQPREWTSGFFPGCLWLEYEQTKDPFFEREARRWTERLKEIQYYGGSHDVGFLIFSSYGNGFRLKPSDEYKKVILQTAQTLMTRFNPIVGCIRSWDHGKWGYPVIVDNMMNLELLFWAAENGGTTRMREIAISHAEKTMQNHVRSDGSTYHVLDYDTTNGNVIARVTHQGYADESAWARGQAWAVYGFTMTYRFTRDERFLQTARRVADYFVEHLPADHIPYWDFHAPNIPDEERDVSAGAIAASALYELAEYVDAAKKIQYRDAANGMLRSLCSSPYLAEGTSSHGILNHAVGSKPGKSEVDVSIIYADYYFLEALKRYRKPASSSEQFTGVDVASFDRARILKAAAQWLTEPPITITAFRAERSAGGANEFYSEGDYWWPDPQSPDSPYVRRDGMSNPDNFTKHREAMVRFSQAVSTLAAAYKITRDEKYAAHAVKHLKAWFVNPSTKMLPHLKYAQAIKGRVTGRGIGIIDTIHLIEVARAVEALSGAASFSEADAASVKRWFAEYLGWMTTHPYGIDERETKNNHATWWVAQAAAFAHLTANAEQLSYCRERFRNVILPNQMAADGSFPLELRRTKPYDYSIFNLEGVSAICQILSQDGENLWTYTLSDGRGAKKGMEFLFPYLKDKSTWPYPKDVMDFDARPVRQSFLLFAGKAFSEQKYIDLWKTLDADPTIPEVQRGMAIRQPVLWID